MYNSVIIFNPFIKWASSSVWWYQLSHINMSSVEYQCEKTCNNIEADRRMAYHHAALWAIKSMCPIQGFFWTELGLCQRTLVGRYGTSVSQIDKYWIFSCEVEELAREGLLTVRLEVLISWNLFPCKTLYRIGKWTNVSIKRHKLRTTAFCLTGYT